MTEMQNTEQLGETSASKRGLNAQDLTYEQSIAYYIVGQLVLLGALDPRDFNFDIHTGSRLPHCVHVVAEGLLHGLREYGWDGSIQALITAADIGSIAQHQQQQKGGAA